MYLVNMFKIGLDSRRSPGKSKICCSHNESESSGTLSKSAQMAEIYKGGQKGAWNLEPEGQSQAAGTCVELVAARLPLLSLWSLTLYYGAFSPGVWAKVPSLQSMSSLPWEMVSSPFSSFADFICISPDLFTFPSASAGSQWGLGMELPHSQVTPLILLLVGPVWACFGSTILSVIQAIK